MKHVSILIPKGDASLVNIEGTHQILTQVNSFLEAQALPPAFHIQLVGLSPETHQKRGLFTIKPEVLVEQVKKTDLIFVPALFGDPLAAAELNRAFIPWIVQQHARGAEVACYCVGTFFLAQTGLLDGKTCATHWSRAADFKAMFPHIPLVDDKIMTADDGVYTSGGAYSYLNLLLYLVERHTGRDMAIRIAKTFMIDIDKHSQSPFIIFEGQKTHDDRQIKKAQTYIEENYAERITVEDIASLFALGRRSLERRFKKATSNTVSEYIQRVKIEAAKKDLESGQFSVLEVMYKVGYSDGKAFRRAFRKITGLTPMAYRQRYSEAFTLS